MTRNICIQKFNSLLNDMDKSEKIEESIYNYTMEQSLKKGIDKDIDNKYFKRIYVNKIMNIYIIIQIKTRILRMIIYMIKL